MFLLQMHRYIYLICCTLCVNERLINESPLIDIEQYLLSFFINTRNCKIIKNTYEYIP